jgi:hypothetical protein
MGTVDLYCERLGPGLWAEPVNAATNAAFLVAAWFVWRYAQRTGTLSVGAWVLIGLTVSVGVGSALFHTVADDFTRLLDSGAIAVFMAAYLWLYGRGVIGLSRLTAAIAPAAFIAAVVASAQLPPWLNGSVMYAPALVGIVGLGVLHLSRARHERYDLIWAAAVFVVSLLFRSIDMWVCPAFPVGTHFLWHLSNSVALYIATRALLANLSGQPAAGGTPPPRDAAAGLQA